MATFDTERIAASVSATRARKTALFLMLGSALLMQASRSI